MIRAKLRKQMVPLRTQYDDTERRVYKTTTTVMNKMALISKDWLFKHLPYGLYQWTMAS